jgi:GWxTD domain-containing protein
MKKIILILLGAFLVGSLHASNINAALSYCTFYSPADGPYLETYLSVWAKSIRFVKTENGKYRGSVGITMIFRQGNDIREYKKYELKSPETEDTLKVDFSFIDQQRFLLPDGNYILDFQITDLNDSGNITRTSTELTISYPTDKMTISGIQLLEKFSKTENQTILSKSGYDLVPYPDNFLPKSMQKLAFYAEIYHAEKTMGENAKYLLSYFIRGYENERTIDEFAKVRKETAKPVGVVLHEFDIQSLPSGNYLLIIEARNQANEVVASSSLFFQRSNPDLQLSTKDLAALNIQNTFVATMTNKDTLTEYIRSLAPISSEIEKAFAKNQLHTLEMLTLQQYFLNFWMKRAPVDPQASWLKYKEAVANVQELYRTPIKKGYETDRGRIHLKHGPPNTIADQSFQSSDSGMHIDNDGSDGSEGTVPYQIWHYYELSNHERNVKFVFANPNLATNDYILIHSNAEGEVNNPNWQSELSRHVGVRDADDIAPSGKYKNKSGDLYNNPR